MVFAYASSILVVQYNYTELNQTNFALCVTDLVILIIGLIISFWFTLPYNSPVANICSILYSLVLICYNSVSIYLYRYDLEINNNYYNSSIAIIVITTLLISFECIRKCFGIRHWMDAFIDDDFSTVSSDFYAIIDIFDYCFYDYDCCECSCCDICYETCSRQCKRISDKINKINQELKKVKHERKLRREQRKLKMLNQQTQTQETEYNHDHGHGHDTIKTNEQAAIV